jgi:glycolate oxidase
MGRVPEYSQVDQTILSKLSSIVGDENVSLSSEDLEKHSIDESPLKPHPPSVVVKPSTTHHVSEIMKLASQNRIPVTPQGSRTGLSGANHPVYGGIALDMEGMNKILELDEDNLMITVEPGVYVMDVHAAAAEMGLLYPPDPGENSGTIGGNINTNAGGMRAMKYGVTRDFVNGIEVVLPRGEVVEMGGKVVKDSTGYSLIDLIIGSEGTLGVVTKATLRLVPKPLYTALIYAPFESVDDAAKAVSEIIKRKVAPFALEFMTGHAVQTIERYLERKLPDNSHPAYLIVGVESNDEEQLMASLESAGEACLELGAVEVYLAETQKQQDEMWEARKAMADAYDAFYDVDEADICVPRSKVPEFVRLAMPLEEKYGVILVPVGHAGDGNIHWNVVRKEQGDEEWLQTIEGSIEDLIQLSISLGGTVSGEHGLGFTKKRFLPLKVGDTQVELMKGIKKLFDPENIMNPGKVFP